MNLREVGLSTRHPSLEQGRLPADVQLTILGHKGVPDLIVLCESWSGQNPVTMGKANSPSAKVEVRVHTFALQQCKVPLKCVT